MPISVTDRKLEFFRFSVDQGVGLLELNRPPANAHNLDMLRELDNIVLDVRFDDSVKVVIVTSSSPTMFSAGFDIKVIRDADPVFVALSSQFSKEVMQRIAGTRKIFIAAINGHCMGGGLEIAMACDLRFCVDDDRVKIGMPEITLGLIPGEGGNQMLGRAIGKSKALDLMITGESFGPKRALEMGIVDKLFPGDLLQQETRSYARRIADGPLLAIGFNKLALNEGVDLPINSAFALEREMQNQCLLSDDGREGAQAFFEKRSPRFTGR